MRTTVREYREDSTSDTSRTACKFAALSRARDGRYNDQFCAMFHRVVFGGFKAEYPREITAIIIIRVFISRARSKKLAFARNEWPRQRNDATRVLRDQEEKNSEKERKKRINAAPKKYYYRWMIKSKCRAYRIYPPLSAIARDECSIRDGIIT